MTDALKTYQGSCHCGAVQFSFLAPEITAGRRCNCSFCIRKGAVMSVEWVPPERFLSLTGRESLTVYNFGDDMVNHYFCKRCGIHPFAEVKEKPGLFRLNLGCVAGVDALALEIGLIDGRQF